MRRSVYVVLVLLGFSQGCDDYEPVEPRAFLPSGVQCPGPNREVCQEYTPWTDEIDVIAACDWVGGMLSPGRCGTENVLGYCDTEDALHDDIVSRMYYYETGQEGRADVVQHNCSDGLGGGHWTALGTRSTSSAASQPIPASNFEGHLNARIHGRTLEMRSAHAVFHGGRSFRMYASTHARDCAWAEGGGTGMLRPGEATLSIDFAPLQGPDGSEGWHAVGAGWLGDNWDSGNAGFVRWPAGLTPSRQGQEVRLTVKDLERELEINADLSVGLCPPNANDVDVDPTPPSMTLRLGGRLFPLSHAIIEPLGQGRSIRVRHHGQRCGSDVTHEDAYITLYLRDDETVWAVTAGGLAVPDVGQTRPPGRGLPIVVSITEDTLVLEGTIHVEDRATGQARQLELEVQGRVPLRHCGS